MGCEKTSALNVELCMHTYARVCYHDGSQGKNWKWNADPSAKHLSRPLCSTFPTGSGFLCICLDKIQQHNKNCNHRHNLHSLYLYPSVCIHGEIMGYHAHGEAACLPMWTASIRLWSSSRASANAMHHKSCSDVSWDVIKCVISIYIRNTRKVMKKGCKQKDPMPLLI